MKDAMPRYWACKSVNSPDPIRSTNLHTRHQVNARVSYQQVQSDLPGQLQRDTSLRENQSAPYFRCSKQKIPVAIPSPCRVEPV